MQAREATRSAIRSRSPRAITNVMSFRIAGKLIERKVRLGDTVRKGQVVARLDPADSQKQVASDQASLEAAEHRLVFAKQQLDRDKAQAAQNLIATTQLEQTQDNYTSALAGRDQAAAQLVVAQNNLQYNTLVADHDGAITSENADTGQVVSAGQAVYGLAWSGETDVTLDAAESDLDRIAVGQFASVSFPALPGRQYKAAVREVAPARRSAEPDLSCQAHAAAAGQRGASRHDRRRDARAGEHGECGRRTGKHRGRGVGRFGCGQRRLGHRRPGIAEHLHRARDRDLPQRPEPGCLGRSSERLDARIASRHGDAL